MQRTIRLKKYANRRLYNPETSEHVTLARVAEMVREGDVVSVFDAKTGEDVTAFILTQIILERAKQRNVLLPAPLLHLVIRYGDNALSGFFDTYLEQTIRNFLSFKKSADAQFRSWLNMGGALSEATLKTLESIRPPFAPKPTGPSAAPEDDEAGSGS